MMKMQSKVVIKLIEVKNYKGTFFRNNKQEGENAGKKLERHDNQCTKAVKKVKLV